MKILMVLTSHDSLGNTGRKTGFWLEEFAAPYYHFRDRGVEIALTSPQGGQPPLDPKSDEPDAQTESTCRFREDREARAALAATRRLSEVTPEDYDAIVYPGGHGPLWDLVADRHSIVLIEGMHAAGKPVALVCHAPAALRDATTVSGAPLVFGKRVTGFSNAEEAAVGLTNVVPLLVEDVLKDKGGRYLKGPDWQSHVEVDGNLITGQNPASSEDAAREVLRQIM